MKRERKQFKMPKQYDPWQKDLLELVGKHVNLERNERQLFKGAKILKVNIQTGKDFKILTKDGKKRTLVGGSYDIEEIEEDEVKGAKCPETLKSERKCYIES